MPENVDINVENAQPSPGNAENNSIATENAAAEPTPASNYELNKFQLTRILQNNTLRKTIALLGTFPDISSTDAAVVFFEKEAFRECHVQTPASSNGDNKAADGAMGMFSEALQVRTEFINNIYGSFQCIPPSELSGIKTTVVYPATEKHVEKYSATQKFLIDETPALYEQLTLPFITQSQFTLDWVYNILEHKQETERIVFEDNDPEIGFILLPDMKWDGKTLETLYLLAIVHKHGIKSLRDLNASHLPLLRNMRDRIAEAIEERYGLTKSQLRMYFHYQPSFYHLHLHINPVRGDAPGIWCEKSHMLQTVISNLELVPDYYQRVTLPFVLFEGSNLLERFVEEKAVQKQKQQVSVETEQKADNNEQGEDLSMPPQKKPKLATDNEC